MGRRPKGHKCIRYIQINAKGDVVYTLDATGKIESPKIKMEYERKLVFLPKSGSNQENEPITIANNAIDVSTDVGDAIEESTPIMVTPNEPPVLSANYIPFKHSVLFQSGDRGTYNVLFKKTII